MAMVAQDTFVAELKSGPVFVQKGAVYADGHEVVKLDAGRGMLFKPLDLGEEEDKPEAKSAAKPPARGGKAG